MEDHDSQGKQHKEVEPTDALQEMKDWHEEVELPEKYSAYRHGMIDMLEKLEAMSDGTSDA